MTLFERTEEAIYIIQTLLESQVVFSIYIPIWCKDNIHKNLVDAFNPTLYNLHFNCDNQETIELTKNPFFNARTKYIEEKHHFI